MDKLQVTADKLNLRNTPFADPTYANWIGDMNKGEEFNPTSIVEGVEYNGTKYWYKDNFNKYASLYGLGDDDPRIPWSLRILGVPHLWNITKGEGIKIGIIDSGIDLKNEDLGAAVIDGFNVLTNDRYIKSVNENCIQDQYFHGSYCSSIAASRGNLKLKGVAPASNLIVIKIADKDEDYTYDNEILGFTKAIELGAQIISMSFANKMRNDKMQECINSAIKLGIICLAATGDYQEDNVRYPANYKNMISVGSVKCLNSDDPSGNYKFEISDESTGGSSDFNSEGVTIVAPGDGVSGYNIDGTVWQPIKGTSYSVPYITGLAALWLSIQKQNNKIINYHESFRNFLISNANKNFDNYTSKYWGNGLVNPLSILLS